MSNSKQIAFMFSVKEALLQFEDLKEKYNQEYDMKEKESFKLKYGIRNMNYKTSCWTSMKTRSTANNSKKQQMNNVDFSVAQKLNKSPCFRNVSLRAALHRNRALAAILEQTKEEFTEMIQSKDSSLQGLRKVKNDKQRHQSAAAGGKLFTEVKTNKEHTFQMVQLRQDIHQHEDKYTELLANFNELHCEKTVIQQQFVSRSSSVKAVEENLKLDHSLVYINLFALLLAVSNEGHILKVGLTKQVKWYLSLLNREEVKSIENKSQEKCQETEILQKKFEANYERLEEGIAEKEKQIKSVETKLRSLRKKFEIKLKAQEEYQKEVQKLKSTAAEATKNKEDTELKCQHQIADMVALMEKHKPCDGWLKKRMQSLMRQRRKRCRLLHIEITGMVFLKNHNLIHN
ncbi:hypothetical protein F7725_004966 [Dissostichus mawsoni]|uniref:Uncharacterized protein n=1 Tax=Dissostichus mawsoni TaxID=36200 RepID=A0A7J5XK94_DISMA|nr:hypothetical protein F7725_004966 [Dissostichus mawsoni]